MTHASEPFSVDHRRDGDHTVLSPRGELDMATADRLRAEFDALIEGGCRTVVLDLRGVTFLDSTGLRTLFATNDAAARHGAEMTVMDGDPRVSRVLELTGAWRVLRRAEPEA